MPALTITQQGRYCQPVTNVRDLEPAPYVIPLNLDGTELLSFNTVEPGGWAAYFSEATKSAYVLVRVGPEAGLPSMPVVQDGRVDLQAPADHAAGQALEVRELRVAVFPQTAGFASSLLREIPFTRIEAAVNHPTHRQALARLVLPANAVGLGNMPEGTRYLLKPEPVRPTMPGLQIDDPGGYRKPDDFYRTVADVYLSLAAVSARPAQELAEANGTPVATVHRWVREAKARGVLKLPAHRPAGKGDE